MERHPMIYEISFLKTPSTAFNGIEIILGGGNSLIINELEQKPSDFTENLLKEYSGGSSSCSSSSLAAIFLPERERPSIVNKSQASKISNNFLLTKLLLTIQNSKK